MPAFLKTDIGEPDYLPDSSWLEHGPFAMWLVRRIAPRVIVELGTHHGYSYFCMCQQVLQSGLATKCHAVDTWQGDEHSLEYGEEVFDRVRAENERYAAFSTLWRMYFAEAVTHFEDGSIDLLHIDGRHYYEDVRTDFETWLPKLSSRGIVLLHDTEVHDRNFGVHRFFSEIARDHPVFNFPHGNGLGIVFVGRDIPEGARAFVRLIGDPDGQAFVRDYFALAGSRIPERAVLRRKLAEGEAAKAEARRAQASADDLAQRLQAQEAKAAGLAQTLDELRAQIADQTARQAAERAAEQDRHAATARQLAERAAQGEALRDAADRRARELADVAHQIAARAAKAERYPFRTVARRLGYGIAKGLATVSAMKGTRLARASQRFSEKHSPKRHYALLAAPAPPPAGPVPLVAEEAAVPLLSGRHYLDFAPGGGGDGALTADQRGVYRLTTRDPGYTYVLPRRPEDFAERLAALGRRPRFSIVMPTFNTPPALLAAAIGSVQGQWYDDWDLVIADDASTEAGLREALSAIDDPRITVLWQARNGGISAATNAALDRAAGDYVLFLDHDDELTPDCLWELALAINETGADFLYSDEDKIDEEGRFVQPFFKPDWSPDTLMSTMYTCHVSCVRRALLQEVGPLKPQYDGAQDWDLILRVTERARRIAHVPKVLYHWRIIPASIAASLSAKPKAVGRAQALREAALARRGTPGIVESVDGFPAHHRINYLPQGRPRLSVIIPSRNNGAVLKACVQSLFLSGGWENTEVIVVDNGSDDPGTLGVLDDLKARHGIIVLRHDRPFNYSELNNVGLAASTGEVVLFLNDDTEVSQPDAFARMIGFAQLPHVGAVGAKLLYPGGTLVQHAGIVNLASGPGHAFLRAHQAEPGYFLRNHLEYDWLAVTGACLMMTRAKLDEIGPWDEGFPIAYNDVDLCFRAHEAGYFNVVCQAARLIHHESLSRGIDHASAEGLARLNEDRLRLYEKHPDLFMRDPFHNPNLHVESLHFALPGAA